MAHTRERRTVISLLIFATIIAVLGGITVPGVEAKGWHTTKTSLSVRDRVGIQSDNCEMAGGEISVSYGYESDGSESATTSCSGGLLNGNTCINEEGSMTCRYPSRTAPTHDEIVVESPAGMDGTMMDGQAEPSSPRDGVPLGGVAETNVQVSDGADASGQQQPAKAPIKLDASRSILVQDQPSEEDASSDASPTPMPVLVPLG